MERVAQEFAARVAQGDLGDLQVIYRVAGGMPSQRVEYEIAVDSVTGAQIAVSNARLAETEKRDSIPPERLGVPTMFEELSAGLHSLRPAEDAISLPDSLVGSLTIRVNNEEETFYFVPEQEKRRSERERVAPSMDRALERFWGIATGAIEGTKVHGHE